MGPCDPWLPGEHDWPAPTLAPPIRDLSSGWKRVTLIIVMKTLLTFGILTTFQAPAKPSLNPYKPLRGRQLLAVYTVGLRDGGHTAGDHAQKLQTLGLNHCTLLPQVG